MGGKPSKGTAADGRLKANKGKTSKTAASSSAAKPAFGTPAWQAKYGNKSKGK